MHRSLTLAQIDTFDSIVRLGSFHAAARELGLTQPSVSQRVRELETTLNTKLFIRRGPRVSLTAQGHALEDHARRLLGDANSIVARFRDRDQLRGMLRLGLNESFALVGLPDLLQKLRAQHPDLRTSVHVGDTADVARLLNGRKLDVAIVSQPDLEAHVQAEPIGINRFAWFAGPGIGVPRRALKAAELARFHLAISPESSRLYATATAWFARDGVASARLSLCNSLPVTIRMVLRGLAVGLLPIRVMREHLRAREVRIMPVTPEIAGHRVSLCYQASEFGPQLERVLSLTRAVIAEQRVFMIEGAEDLGGGHVEKTAIGIGRGD
jgi:DNA-binding transcriptional LysR family regulator